MADDDDARLNGYGTCAEALVGLGRHCLRDVECILDAARLLLARTHELETKNARLEAENERLQAALERTLARTQAFEAAEVAVGH